MLPEDVDKLYAAAPTAKWCHSLPLPLHIGCWLSATGTLQRSAVNGDSGRSAPGTSSGDAMALMENLASKYLRALVMTGRVCRIRNAYREPGSRSGSYFLCGCFPVPCCTYESWSIPVSVMLVVPLGIVACYWRQHSLIKKMTSTLWWAANDNWLVGQKRYFDC